MFRYGSLPLFSFRFSWWVLKTHIFQTKCNSRLRSPESVDLVAVESAYATSCYSSIVTLVLSCSVSEILQVLMRTALSAPETLDRSAAGWVVECSAASSSCLRVLRIANTRVKMSFFAASAVWDSGQRAVRPHTRLQPRAGKC